jgi:quinoprotein glucose dehydrogenase
MDQLRVFLMVCGIGLSTLVELPVMGAELGSPKTDPERVRSASDEGKLAMKKFLIPDGFEVELTAAEPHLANPVAFHIDERGRFFVVETFRHGAGVLDIRGRREWPNKAFIEGLSKERLASLSDELLDADLASRTVDDRIAMLRYYMGNKVQKALGMETDQIRLIEDRDGDGVAERSSVFANGFNQIADGLASGILARQGKVYFANIPDLWLLEDPDGDGVAEKRQSIHYGFGVRVGFLGHDLHGLKFGPDGKLYFTIGDRGSHVRTGNGRVIGNPDTGCVFRCNPDGSDLEVFAYGLRNPQELAFDAYGNLFTGDNNSDGGDEARWVYLVEGGDSGWRIGYQFLNKPVPRGPWNAEKLWHPQWDGQAAYLVPPIANIGNGPSGLTYHPGTGFPKALQDHFFLVDFKGSAANSGIHSFRMEPHGATFILKNQQRLIWNILATDADFGVNGGLYVTDWVEGWDITGKGRIYRFFDPTSSTNSGDVKTTKALMADGMEHRGLKELKGLLSHDDMRIRQEAQFAMASRGQAAIQPLAEVLTEEKNLFARLHALWGLGQLLPKIPKAARPIMEALYAQDAEVRAQAAKIAGTYRLDTTFGRLALLCSRDESSRVRFFAALALGKFGHREAIDPLVTMLEANNGMDPYLRHAGVMGLTGLQDFRWLEALAEHPSPSVRMGVLLAMRRLERPEIARFLTDTEGRIVTEAARAINDIPIEGATRDLANLASARDLNEATWRRVINANFRLGRAEYANQLGQITANSTIKIPIRVEALAALSDWAQPSGRDRVTGIWNPVSTYRSVGDAKRALQSVISRLKQDTSEEIIAALIGTVGGVELKTAVPWLFETVRRESLEGRTRASALVALAKLGDDTSVRDTVTFASKSDSRRLRQEALRWQEQSADSLQTIRRTLAKGDFREQQSAIAALARDRSAEALSMMSELTSKLLSGNLQSELTLDLMEAIESSGAETLQKEMKGYLAALETESALKGYAMTMHGGDAEVGRRIFLEREEVACLRCHKINGNGGEVGPALDALSKRSSLDQILESILYPNQEIAEGFESVLIETKDDHFYAGLIKEENEETLLLNSPEDGMLTIQKNNIHLREKGLSGMPEGLILMLTKRELRDLIAFLGSLD